MDRTGIPIDSAIFEQSMGRSLVARNIIRPLLTEMVIGCVHHALLSNSQYGMASHEIHIVLRQRVVVSANQIIAFLTRDTSTEIYHNALSQ